MRIPHALALATAYALGRPQPARKPAPGAGSEPPIVEPLLQIAHTDGKRWRIEGPNWTMQPVGEISAEEARAVCERIVAALWPAPAVSTRAIPSLRARTLEDAMTLVAEQFSVLQAARNILASVDDAEGPAGDVIRITAAFLDDALTDLTTDTAATARA